jgi:3D (Asp-Asp-Asp) domain-containing protein
VWYGRPVLGQAQTSRRRLVALALIGCVVLVLPAIGVANPLKHRSSGPARSLTIATGPRPAALDLFSLDHNVVTAQTRVATFDQRIAALRAERAVLRQQVHVAHRGISTARSELCAAMRTLYEQGDVEPLEIILGAKSLDQALTSIDELSRMRSQAHDLVQQLTAIEARATKTEQAVSRREASLVEAARQARAAQAAALAALAARRDYLARLAAQNMAQAQVATVQSQAQAAETRSSNLTVAATSSLDAPLPQVSGGDRVLTVSATAYSLPGYTASGLHVAWGVVAVDPRVIPLGTRMTVPGYGEAIAADVGTAIIGDRIDLWFPTLAQAQAWGRQTVTIIIH